MPNTVVEQKQYPVNPADYEILEDIGQGVSATVYRALCKPLNETVAIKSLDLEKCNSSLVSAVFSLSIIVVVDSIQIWI